MLRNLGIFYLQQSFLRTKMALKARQKKLPIVFAVLMIFRLGDIYVNRVLMVSKHP